MNNPVKICIFIIIAALIQPISAEGTSPAPAIIKYAKSENGRFLAEILPTFKSDRDKLVGYLLRRSVIITIFRKVTSDSRPNARFSTTGWGEISSFRPKGKKRDIVRAFITDDGKRVVIIFAEIQMNTNEIKTLFIYNENGQELSSYSREEVYSKKWTTPGWDNPITINNKDGYLNLKRLRHKNIVIDLKNGKLMGIPIK